MKFTIAATAFEQLLKSVSKAASKRNVQILGGVHLALKDGVLTATTTNMELCLQDTCPVVGKSGDSIVALDLPKIIKGVGTLEESVSVSVNKRDAILSISDKEGTTLRYGLGQVEDYPALPFDFVPGQTVTTDHKAFEVAFSRIGKSFSSDESRPVLGGVCLDIGEHFKLVATDSYRLAVSDIGEFKVGPKGKRQEFGTEVVLSGADLKTALGLLGGERLVLTRLDRWVSLDDGKMKAAVRVVDGKFPNWRQLIPDNREITLTFDREALVKATSRIAKLSNGTNMPLRLTPGDGDALLSLNDYDLAKPMIETRLSAEADGEFPSSTIGINPQFLAEAIAVIPGEKVSLHLINPIRPILVTPEPQPRIDSLSDAHLIMPVRLAG